MNSCPECNDSLEIITDTNVWMCAACDYGETDELHQHRIQDTEVLETEPVPNPRCPEHDDRAMRFNHMRYLYECLDCDYIRTAAEIHAARDFHYHTGLPAVDIRDDAPVHFIDYFQLAGRTTMQRHEDEERILQDHEG